MSKNKLETIKAFNSKMELIDVQTKETRMINGEYYIIGESCIQMRDGQYYRINSSKIYFNHTTQEWQNSKKGLVYGIINNNKGIPVVGYFAPNTLTVNVLFGNKRPDNGKSYYPLTVETSNLFLDASINNPRKCVSISLAEELGFIESLQDDNYYYKDSLTSSDGRHMLEKGRALYNVENLPYNIADDNAMGNAISKAYVESKHETTYLDEEIIKVIGDKSFGLEIETSLGHLPERILNQTGLVPLRDGSIRGIEYTTVPLEGIKGVANLRTIFKEMNKRCETDQNCSLHIHFGKFPCTKKSTLALYSLCYRLQNELFEIVPPYKRSLEYFQNKLRQGGRLKDHCQPLSGLALNTGNIYNPNVDTNTEINAEFDKIFQFLTEGRKQDQNYNFETRRHPREGANKWNWESRYYHVNLIPLLFSNSRTVEFRLHQSTIHYSVMMHWMLICSSILTYAEKNQDQILQQKDKISLLDVIAPIKDINPEIFKKLDTYIEFRRDLFNNDKYRDMYAEVGRDLRSNSIPNKYNYESIQKSRSGIAKQPKKVDSASPVLQEQS